MGKVSGTNGPTVISRKTYEEGIAPAIASAEKGHTSEPYKPNSTPLEIFVEKPKTGYAPDITNGRRIVTSVFIGMILSILTQSKTLLSPSFINNIYNKLGLQNSQGLLQFLTRSSASAFILNWIQNKFNLNKQYYEDHQPSGDHGNQIY